MKTLLTILCFLALQLGNAQIVDNFDDSDLSITPKWEGQINNFVGTQMQLRSNCNLLNSTFYISTVAGALRTGEFRIDTRLLFNTSSANYVDLILYSDSLDLLKMKNGYFVRLGGTTDEVSFYKTKNGVETKLIDGIDNALNTSNNQWTIILKKLLNNTFVLQRTSIGGGPTITEGSVTDSTIINAKYLGIRIKQSTASFINKHYFDNLYYGSIIRDSIAPLVDSFYVVGSQKLRCHFNEACDSLGLVDVMNYIIDGSNIHPQSINYENANAIVLNFKTNFQPNTPLKLRIENIKDTAGNAMSTVLKPFYYSRPDTALFHQLLITELMPDPSPVVALADKEYVELTNHSKRFLQLNGCQIHDASGPKSLPNLILAPDSIVVLYTIPSLNNAGDRIWLTNQFGDIIHEVNYIDTWYRDTKKQNGGWSLEMIDMNNSCEGSSNWMASKNKNGGTPGFINSLVGMANSDFQAPQIRNAIALNDSTIRVVFDEEIDSLHSVNFILMRNGIRCSVKRSNLIDGFSGMDWIIDFIPSLDSVYLFEISGITDCMGNPIVNGHFELQWPSIANKNELIFNELLFNPKSGGYDFIELYNNSKKAIDLSKHFIAVYDEQGQYKSIEKISLTPLILKPFQYLLMSENTSKICMNYTCKSVDALMYSFNKMPSMPDDAGNLILVNMKGELIDSIAYLDDWHYPLLSDKEGVSLERISFTNTSRASDNWHSAASAVGFATPGYLNSQSIGVHGGGKYFNLQNTTVSPDNDGFEDVLILNYQLPKPDYATTIKIFDLEGRLIQDWANNTTLGTEGFLSWNGTDYNQQKAAIGIYIVMIESVHPNGDKIKEKMSCVVAGKF